MKVGAGGVWLLHIPPLLLLLELWYTDQVNTSLFPANNKLPTGKLPAKIMAIDLDDTLLREDLTISDYTIQTLQKATAAGIYVTLCSGRTDNAILPFVRQLEIAGLEQGRFIIAQNGAVIYDLHLRREILYHTVDVDVLLEANEIAASYGLFPEVYNPTTVFTSQDNKWTQVDVGLTGLQMEVVPDFPALLRKGHPKMVIPGEPEVLLRLQDELREKIGSRCVIFISKPYFLEIMPYNCGKGEALQWLCQRLAIPNEHAMSFGDSMNDESMIQLAGLSVSMINGLDVIKEQARYVTEFSNNEDGLARFVEKYVL
ncbi:MAG: HAD family phosphatase [Spirochaetaceae bacterium]|nr:HAD family phosphatase [Spirochaetaceae bacterium]